MLGNLPRGVKRSSLNVVVITLDTFRADRLSAYGSTRGLTPHLDRLGRQGVVFEATQSVAPLTLPAHCSLFTGRFPPAHGVHENAGILRAAAAVIAPRAAGRPNAMQSAGTADGAIYGTVTDSTGAALPDVTVVVSSDAPIGDEGRREGVTNAEGAFRLDALPPRKWG